MKNSQSYFSESENDSYLGTEGVFIYIRVTYVKKCGGWMMNLS